MAWRHRSRPKLGGEECGFKVGDHVEWNSRVAHREGHVTEKLIQNRDGTRASAAHPKFVVVDECRGKEYARNPDKLHKLHKIED